MKNEDPRDEAEGRVRAAFEELRAEDQTAAPPFASLWGRPAAARRSLFWWLVPIGAAAASVLVVVAIGIGSLQPPPPPTTAAPAPELVGVREPEPLAFLLERPRGEEP